jgi:hypothetical protein
MSELECHNFGIKQESLQHLPAYGYGVRKEHQYIYEDISFDSSRITESEQEQQSQRSQISDS